MASPKNGFELTKDGTLKINLDGTERIAFDSTGVSLNGATPVAQQPNIADVTVTGTYASDDDAIETAINSIIAVLEAYGLTATS